MGWQFVSTAAQVVLQVVVIAILARLLAPTDFGTFAVAMLIIGFMQLLGDLGVGSAIVQKKQLNHYHVRAGFIISLITGLLLAVLVWATAPAWAMFFQNAAMTPLIQLLSISFLLTSLSSVSQGLLWRKMDLRALAVAELGAYALGYGVVAIILAMKGFGVWALAWGILVLSATRTLILFFFETHAVLPKLKFQETREMLSFGVGISLTRVFNYAATRGDYFIIGRWLGAKQLGFYERAYKLMELPVTTIAGLMNRVAFPAMSETQDDNGKLSLLYLNAVGLVSIIYIPMAVFLAVLAPQIIRTLLGPEWTRAIVPFQIMCIGLVFRASHKISDCLVRAKGAVYQSAWRVLLYAASVIAGASAGLRWGIKGVSAGIVLAIFIKYVLLAHLSLKLLGLDRREFIRSQKGGLIFGGILLVLLSALASIFRTMEAPDWLALLVLTPLGITALTVAALTLPSEWLGPEFAWATRTLSKYSPWKSKLFVYLASRASNAA